MTSFSGSSSVVQGPAGHTVEDMAEHLVAAAGSIAVAFPESAEADSSEIVAALISPIRIADSHEIRLFPNPAQ